MVPSFYNAADRELYKKYKFLPQEKYRLGLTLPTDPDPVVNQGIVNTNAFNNSEGNGVTGIPNSLGGPGPHTMITGGFSGAGYGVDPITGNIMGGGNIVDEFGIDGNVYSGTGITPGVNTVTGDLPGGGNIVDEFQEDGKNYSKGAFDEEEDKKSFISNMISRANQIGSSIPGWAKTAAKSYSLGTLLANPYAMVLPTLSGVFKGGKSYQQYDPRGTFKDGVYSIDGVNYTNSSMVNDSYDPETGLNRFDRAPIDSFRSFRTLKGYLDSKKDSSPNTTTGISYDADPGSKIEGGPNENNPTAPTAPDTIEGGPNENNPTAPTAPDTIEGGPNENNPTAPTAPDTSENTSGGYSCFIAGTKVTMSDDTFKNIEDIKVGDKIKGHKENNEVIKLDPTLLANRKLYSFNNNEHYFFTSEHPFMTEEGWKSVKPEKTKERDGIELYNQLEGELKIGDKLVTDKGLIEITDIKSKEINKPDMPLYNFNVSNDNSYIADGYVVHNKGGGGGTYVCTASYANNLITPLDFKALKKYGIKLRRNDKYLMKAYDWFGPKLAAAVKKGELVNFAKHSTSMWKYEQTKEDVSFKIKFMSRLHKIITRPIIRVIGIFITIKEKLTK